MSELYYWSRKGIVAVEMECSTLFTLTSMRGLKSGAILVVDGNIVEGSGRPFRKIKVDLIGEHKVKTGLRRSLLIALGSIVLMESNRYKQHST